MNSILVRQAGLSDLTDLASLFDQYRQFQGKSPDLTACQTFLQERLNNRESVAFLARLLGESEGDGKGERQPLGFAQLYPSFSSTALARVFILNDLYVAPAGRRMGIASALLAEVENYAWSFDACRVTLNVTQVNVSAHELYKARGWAQDGEFFMYHRFPVKQ